MLGGCSDLSPHAEPPMKAILSDIHGNLEALLAVLEDIDRQQVETIYCLGDVVGYGPDPCDCFDLVMRRCQVVLVGNHEAAVFAEPVRFSRVAEQAILWTKAQLKAPRPNVATANLRWA